MSSIVQIGSPSFSFDGFRGDSSTFTSLYTDVGSRRSFSYHKLPSVLFKLSILKLDGSSFEIQLTKTASVAELKLAIEDFFQSSPKEGQGKISWSHVWGHFCLSFQGHKLVNDKACIRSFGIKDGDQLHFIRHLSMNYSPVKKSRTCKANYEKETNLSSGPCILEEEELRLVDDEDEAGSNVGQERVDKYYLEIEEGRGKEMVCHTEFKLAQFLRGWLSYSRLWSRVKSRSQRNAHNSRFPGHFLRVGTKASLL